MRIPHLKIKVNKPNYVIFISIVIIIASMVMIFLMDDKTMDSSQVLSLATALIGVISLGSEIRRTKDIAEAEFLVNLNHNFVTNEEYRKCYDLFEGYDFEQLEDIDIPNSLISNYLTFFETFQLLIDRKVLKLEMLDDLFAYRFFLAVHNPYVQKAKIVKSPLNFVNIYRLEKAWIEYRHKIGRTCFREEYSLCNRLDKERYEAIVNVKSQT